MKANERNWIKRLLLAVICLLAILITIRIKKNVKYRLNNPPLVEATQDPIIPSRIKLIEKVAVTKYLYLYIIEINGVEYLVDNDGGIIKLD